MKKLWLITGATGHIGTVLVAELLRRDETVRALVLPGEKRDVPGGVQVCEGDVTDAQSMVSFFDVTGFEYVTLIHCAALITIASKRDERVWNVNVRGTENVMRCALQAGVQRVVYVSSVHAIPEKPFGEVITEVDHFSPDSVHGQYAKSKAAAAEIALSCAKRGLNVSIVHPSGVIGPGDLHENNHMIRTIRAMASGKISAGMTGGYDFVDSRDVADGILACEDKGRSGECYILSGHYVTISELLHRVRRLAGKKENRVVVPYGVVKAIAPVAERVSALMTGKAPLLTPYSVYTLHTNGDFSHEKATRELGYHPRDLSESIEASLEI